MTPAAQPRVIVLDDDPTGSQCAADVDVLLAPTEFGVPEFIASSESSVFALTNTRAVGPRQATDVVTRIRLLSSSASADVCLVLRGDSTLRGHLIAEMRALGLDGGVGLFVPAFPAAGRVTVDGAHYLRVDGRLVNIADTEFARDPVFGFRGRSLAERLNEVDPGRPTRTLALRDLRADGARAIERALLALPTGGVLVPDAETDADLECIAAGFLAARATGRHVVLRCGAPLAALVAGRPGRTLHGDSESAARRLLVVCGSHTEASTRQLQALVALTGSSIEVQTEPLMGRGAPREITRVVAVARQSLADDGVAVIATSRNRRATHNTLEHGATVMDGLVEVVRRLEGSMDAVISKGGITSAEVVRRGLGAAVARVRGQIRTGVSLWEVNTKDGQPIPVAVVPGNVGSAETLVEIAAFFGHRSPPS
jgi:uncharacterized protein YgbK (DUF1537 family)